MLKWSFRRLILVLLLASLGSIFFISTLLFIDFNSVNIFQQNHQFNINNNGKLTYQNSIKDDDIEIWSKSKSKSKSNTDNNNNDNNNVVNDATFFTICRNSDLLGIKSSIITVEERFNKNYHYPWVFANDEPFTEEFKKAISETVSGDVIFTTIPNEYWDLPLNIDKILLNNQLERLENDGVLYGGNLSYRKMCRFNSGFFYKLKALEKFNWYWRIEPDIKFSCDLNYDLFKIMKDNNKIYGFALAMTEDKRTVRKLWKESRNYFENLRNWKMNIKDGEFYDISNDKASLGFIEQNTDSNELVRGEFNYCHYWTNFEIANLNFFRDEIYDNYFKSLDATGNFFYERWGDAPVHTIAVSYLLSDSQIQYFDNTGYYHGTIGNCPRDRNVFKELHCTCPRTNDFSWKRWSCVPRWFKSLRKDPPHEVHY